MESAASPTAFAVDAEGAPDLAAVAAAPGPLATVYLTTDPDIDNAAHRSKQRWQPLRRQLAGQGAPDGVLDAVEALVPDAHHRGHTLAVVADRSGPLLVHHGAEPPLRDAGWFAPLARIAPLIEWRQLEVPHVLVLADRVGADIMAVSRSGRAAVDEVGAGDGRDPILHKGGPGGWSQRRFQERAENTWEANARAVAERVEQAADLVGARLVLVAGDVRAVAYLREHLPGRLAPLVRELEGSRAVDGGLDALAAAAVRHVATVAAEDTVAILRTFKEERGQRDRACGGVADTVSALAAASVETLLVHDDPDDDRQAWFAPDAALVALDQATLDGYGVKEPERGRLVDALICTAFATGARVRIVPSTAAPEGVGAILRY